MAAFLPKIVSLIRDNGVKAPASREIFVVNSLKPSEGMVHGICIQRVLLLDGGAAGQIDAIIVFLPQHNRVEQGFQGAEALP